MRVPHGAWSRLKCGCSECVATYSFTGIVTSPKLIVPEPIDRAGMVAPFRRPGKRSAPGRVTRRAPIATPKPPCCRRADARGAPHGRRPASRRAAAAAPRPRSGRAAAHAPHARRLRARRAGLASRAQVGRRARARAARGGRGAARRAPGRGGDARLSRGGGGARRAARRRSRARRRDRRARCERTTELSAARAPHPPRGGARDRRALPLEVRKALLRALVPSAGALRYCAHVDDDGPAFFAAVCREGLEGVVAKRADAPYHGGRSRAWLKVKCRRVEDFVIGGWTDPRGSRPGLGAVHLGRREGRDLVYVGRVGAGLSERQLADLEARLRRLAAARCPFTRGDPPRGPGHHWVRPTLVCTVRFTEWTADGKVRHPVFVGLRSRPRAATPRS